LIPKRIASGFFYHWDGSGVNIQYTTACFNSPIVKSQKAEGLIPFKIHYSSILFIHLNIKLTAVKMNKPKEL
jgi:hypothetical protein